MIRKPQDAEKLLCPLRSAPGVDATCITTGCMAWVWMGISHRVVKTLAGMRPKADGEWKDCGTRDGITMWSLKKPDSERMGGCACLGGGQREAKLLWIREPYVAESLQVDQQEPRLPQ